MSNPKTVGQKIDAFDEKHEISKTLDQTGKNINVGVTEANTKVVETFDATEKKIVEVVHDTDEKLKVSETTGSIIDSTEKVIHQAYDATGKVIDDTYHYVTGTTHVPPDATSK